MEAYLKDNDTYGIEFDDIVEAAMVVEMLQNLLEEKGMVKEANDNQEERKVE